MKPQLLKITLFCVAFLAMCATALADSTSGTLYYTTFSGGVNIHKVDYSFTGGSFSFSGNAGLASTPGADGIVFTSDGFLAVGGQSSHVNRVNPTTGAFTTQTTNGPAAFHMSVAPDGSILAASIPGAPVKFNSTLTNPGTPLTFVGGTDSVLDTISFDSTGQGWYTDSGSGGFGNYGKVTLDLVANTYSTTRVASGIAAAHGMAYDSYSNTLVLFGDGHISQVDPATGALIHDLAGFGGTFDQGAVDGKGHIFAANNGGSLTFIDYSSTGSINSADFIHTEFLAGSLDDVAPLSGLGSSVPEPGTLVLLGMGIGSIGIIRRRFSA